MKSGMVGRPMRRPERASTPAASSAPPRTNSSSPTAELSDDVAEEARQVLLPADHDELVAGEQLLGRARGR